MKTNSPFGLCEHCIVCNSVFDRRWAHPLVEQVMMQLRRKWAARGKANMFDELAHQLMGDGNRGDYAAIAAKLGKTAEAVDIAAYRLRNDYRNLLLKEISRTVEAPSEVEDELCYLFEMEPAGPEPERHNGGTEAKFNQTKWTEIINPGAHGDLRALEELCQSYWPPLYAFLRRTGHSPHDAQDLVQGFFAHFLAKDSRLRSAHPSKGRFRSFMLACLRHHVSNRMNWERIRSPKQPLISIDEIMAEERYSMEPAEVTDPARLFDRRWAHTLVEQVMMQLRRKWTSKGKADMFDELSHQLMGDGNRGDYAAIAARLGKTAGAVDIAAYRLRKDYRNLLLKEISRTVEDPSEVEDELRYLFAVFGR